MEENQPPSKKLKQATLSFFKENKEKGALKVPPLSGQGKKRRNSNSSESPNKSLKLSKPFKILSSESPNTNNSKQNPQEDDAQEVSSSSEAENPVSIKSNNGRCCLMERFVKKVPHDCQQEISSTNDELDSSLEKATENNCDKSQNLVILNKPVVISDEENDKKFDCDDNLNRGDKVAEENGGKNELGVSKCNIEERDDVCLDNSTNTDTNAKSNEKSLDTSVTDHPSIQPFTSTPLKPESSEEKCEKIPAHPNQQSPFTPTTSSGKKRCRKVDLAKKAEREALKEKLKQEKESKRLERKRKQEEAKEEKEKLKKEQKEAKEKARQEVKEKLAQEKLEKEKLKEEEKKKKEEERLKKEEEKQKKVAAIELKQEEKRKKEEEKKLREEEKLKEEEMKNKQAEKLKNAFKSFFVKPTEGSSKLTPPAKCSSGLFIPFELKKDMYLAPASRRDQLNEKEKLILDQLCFGDQEVITDIHYIAELKKDTIKPHRTGRVLRKNPQPADEMDLEIIHDTEALKRVFHKVKLLQFHTDYRPPYYGTWRKQTTLSAKNPFKKDEDMFDYEVDSDEEWEEEEPGESLSCSDGEEEKGDENEDDDEDGWMVPHGYLSEDEGCNEDDEITPEKLKLQQQAKAKAWEEEQKRKLQATPMIVVGCFFENSPSSTMSGDVRLLYEYQGVVLVPDIPIATSMAGQLEVEKVEEQVTDVSQVTPTPKGPKRQAVPDEAMPDLIRLVHGNMYGIKKLIKEFRVFWLRKCNTSCSQNSFPEELDPDESLKEEQMDTSEAHNLSCEVQDISKLIDKSIDSSLLDSGDKSKEEGHGCEISKRQLEKKIMTMAIREKRSVCKKMAWYVHDSVLAEFNMSEIELPNMWEYLTSVPSKSPAPNSQVSSSTKSSVEGTKSEEASDLVGQTSKDQRSIMDFALSKKEIVMKQDNVTISTPKILAAKDVLIDSSDLQDKKSDGQRSITDFASHKREMGKKISHCSNKISDTSSLTNPEDKMKESAPIVMQEKKGNQRSIMDFAKARHNFPGTIAQVKSKDMSTDFEPDNKNSKPSESGVSCSSLSQEGLKITLPNTSQVQEVLHEHSTLNLSNTSLVDNTINSDDNSPQNPIVLE